MPSDEQLREQFEVFLATWFDEYDRALLAPKGLSRLKAAFEAGYLSRDAEVQALREALELLEDAMFQGCPTVESCELDPIPGQPQDGDWFDSHALSAWQEIGDWLTRHAGWERHPAGRGRRQFYRPPAQEEEA